MIITLEQIGIGFIAWLALCNVIAFTGLHRKIIKVRYVDKIEGSTRARNRFAYILVRRDIKWRKSSVEHEYLHVRQMFHCGVLPYIFLVKFWPWFDKVTETQAYAVSYKHGRPLDNCAAALMQYGFDSRDDAAKAILKAA